MGRYILLEVDDNAAAESILALLARKEDPEEFDPRTLSYLLGAHAEPIGVFSKPGALCKCTAPKPEQTIRGKKFGWWVCQVCKKPRHGAGHTLMNMLDDPATPGKHRELILCVKWIRGDAGDVRTATSGWQRRA